MPRDLILVVFPAGDRQSSTAKTRLFNPGEIP
jgi:hypothetical protein